jgi:hypothetical protein
MQRSNAKAIRPGLRLLRDVPTRQQLREAYLRASLATRKALARELAEMANTVTDGLQRW